MYTGTPWLCMNLTWTVVAVYQQQQQQRLNSRPYVSLSDKNIVFQINP